MITIHKLVNYPYEETLCGKLRPLLERYHYVAPPTSVFPDDYNKEKVCEICVLLNMTENS